MTAEPLFQTKKLDKLEWSKYILCPTCKTIALTHDYIRPTDWYRTKHLLPILCNNCGFVFHENMTKHFSRVPDLTDEQIADCIGSEGYYDSVEAAMENMPPFSHFGIKIDGKDIPKSPLVIGVMPYQWTTRNEDGSPKYICKSAKMTLDVHTGEPVNWDLQMLNMSGGRYDCIGAEKEYHKSYARWKRNKFRGQQWMYETGIDPGYLEMYKLQHPELFDDRWKWGMIIRDWMIEGPKEKKPKTVSTEEEYKPHPMGMFLPCRCCGVPPMDNQLQRFDDKGWVISCSCGRTSPYFMKIGDVIDWWENSAVVREDTCPMCRGGNVKFVSKAVKNGSPAKVMLCNTCHYRWIE